MEKRIPVTCAIIEQDGLLLAAKRPLHKDQGGLWEFPGGKIHDGETAEQCIIREIKEELNIDIEPLKRLPHSVHSYPDKTIELIPFTAKIVDGTPRPNEHIAVGWFSPHHLMDLQWCQADLPILHFFLQNILK